MHAPDLDTADPLPPPPADAEAAPRAIRVQFQRVPVGFVGDASGGLEAVQLSRTALEGPASAQQAATAVPGSEYDLPCGLALRAVGYRSSPMEGAPFDSRQGIVPTTPGGRVDGSDGLYAAGWLKRGPSGVILTNVSDAAETAMSVLADHAAGKLGAAAAGGGGGGPAIRAILDEQTAPVLDFQAWMRIDALEKERGAAMGKVREKLVSIDEMLNTGSR